MKRMIAMLSVMAMAGPALAEGRDGARHDRWREPVERRLSVTGLGNAEAAPDIARFVIGAELTETDLSAAHERARMLSARIREVVRAAGIPDGDVRTVAMSVDPVVDDGRGESYGPSDRKAAVFPRITGYTVRVALSVTLRDIGKGGDLVDAAVKAGANRVSGPDFGIDDPAALADEARAEAMKDARRRAETLAEAGGFRIGPVVSVVESGSGGPPVPFVRHDMMLMAESSPVPPSRIDAGLSTVDARVDVVFEIIPERRPNRERRPGGAWLHGNSEDILREMDRLHENMKEEMVRKDHETGPRDHEMGHDAGEGRRIENGDASREAPAPGR